jgi:2-polyprenyl-6-methoxyphenol hydroxylase-like FAD-dependent oxidoreductase
VKQGAILPPSTIAVVSIDICILGAGVVGKTLALLLARQRIRVALVMPAPSTVPKAADIRSFALNAASRELLSDLRVWPPEACPVQHMKIFGDRAGQVSFDASPDPLAWIVDAGALEGMLTTALSFASEVSLLTAAPQAALNVICEGRASSTRQAAGVQFEQFAYEQCAVAAHISCEQAHQSTAWQWMQAGEVCALLPRGSSQSGNSVSLVWSVSHTRAQELQAMPHSDFTQALEAATHHQLGRLELTSERAIWPLVLAQAVQWCGSASGTSWVLAGDAAHAVHPLAGQGLNLGLQDARELAQVLAGKPYFRSFGDMRLLRQYERARKGDAALLRLATDGLHHLFSSQDTRLQSLRQWGMQGFDTLAPLKALVMRQASGAGLS